LEIFIAWGGKKAFLQKGQSKKGGGKGEPFLMKGERAEDCYRKGGRVEEKKKEKRFLIKGKTIPTEGDRKKEKKKNWEKKEVLTLLPSRRERVEEDRKGGKRSKGRKGGLRLRKKKRKEPYTPPMCLKKGKLRIKGKRVLISLLGEKQQGKV